MRLNSLLTTGLASSKKYRIAAGFLLGFCLLATPVHSIPLIGQDGDDGLVSRISARLDAFLAHETLTDPAWPVAVPEPPVLQTSWPERKDPFFAAALSWFIPGLGQVYVGKPLKGGLYWLIDNTLFWTAVLNIAHVDIGLERDIGFRFAIRARENLSSARIWTSVGLGLCYLVFHIYNVLDAADDASVHNQRILMQEMRQDGLSLSLTPELGGVSWSRCF